MQLNRVKRVLILGGYGNFGRVIAASLAKENFIQVIVAGRSLAKAKAFTQTLTTSNTPEALQLDFHQDDLLNALKEIQAEIVIHTSGPFQGQGYEVAQACIKAGIHYIDLADGRDFVRGITELDKLAKQQQVLVVSGASSVPCLTSALVDAYQPEFKSLESLDYGITTAQRTARGLATTAAILGYTGKGFKTLLNGQEKTMYGWQGLKARKYAQLGWRLLGNCDIPDLSLFPRRYPSLKTIRFYAGLEISFIHITLWSLSWLVRIGLIKQLEKSAPLLLRLSFMFDWLGSSNSAFHMKLTGKDHAGLDKTITFELTAKSGDGPYIPCMPAILLTKKIALNTIEQKGATPCIGLITLSEYLDSLNSLDIQWQKT